jgi:tetratricopeptide (TPR) repeat protein
MAAVKHASPWRLRPIAVLVAAVVVAGASYVIGPLLDRRPGSQAVRPAAGVPAVALDEEASIAGPAPDAGGDASIAQLTKAIGTWSTNVRTNPKDFISATNLALVYHARGRLTANLDDYRRALDAARLAERVHAGDQAARAVEATVQAGLHDFAGALATASALYAEDPAQVGALATIGDAQLELGRYGEAGASYGRLAVMAPGRAVEARLARLAFVTGDPARALTLARRARDEAVAQAIAEGDSAAADLVFYHYQLAELARLTGDAGVARSEYHAALHLRPDDLAALVGLARIEAYEGNTASAVGLLRRAASIAPQPETLGLLGDLAAQNGDAAEADRQYATVRAIRRLSELAGSVYDRQLIAFELDHGGASNELLDHAKAALAARPDAYGHDVVAWALYRLGRFDAAGLEISVALANGSRDPRLLAHAGAIALAGGDPATGRALLRQALAAGPGLDPLQVAEARQVLGGS